MTEEEKVLRRLKIFFIMFIIGLVMLLISHILGIGQLLGWW